LNIDKTFDGNELIAQVAQGNEKAFAQLVTPLFDRLHGFTLSVTKSPAVAQEVVQDVLLSIWQHREELPGIDNLKGWIYTIARNKAYNALRRQLHHSVSLQDLDAYFGLEPGSADDRILLKDSQELLSQAVTTLPQQQALVFTLSRIEHLSLDEIADRLQISKETVKKHLTRALKTIREFIQTHTGGLPLLYCCLAFDLFGS